MANRNLSAAKSAKNDEFYTQYADSAELRTVRIEEADFDLLRHRVEEHQDGLSATLFESDAPHFDKKKTRVKGKIFVLDHDTNKNGRTDIEDLEWQYMKGDGDFRSDEVCKLRDEADIIVTNPPFSLFREFLAWIVGDGELKRRGAER